MKKYFFAGVLLFVLNVTSFAQTNSSIRKDESIEWSHSWMIEKPDTSKLPSILLIGDSHVERYFPVVTKDLEGK